MGHETIEGVIGTEIKMGNGLLSLGESAGNGLTRRREGNHLNPHSLIITPSGVPHIVIGNSAPATGASNRTEIYIEFVCQLAYRW